jgi:16S rRNA (cytidine1402-2'-O)-methyltransferase
VSDAGTPNISDPGGKLVQLAHEAGVKIVPIPGVSAVTAILSVCGFPADHFTFLGFPPHKKGRKQFFEMINRLEHTVVIYESKHRIEKTLAQLPPNRLLCVGREMTKMFETYYRGTANQVLAAIKNDSSKGEFAIVVAPHDWK